jgi:hypothetical protein
MAPRTEPGSSGSVFEECELRRRLARELDAPARTLQCLQALAEQPCAREIERFQRAGVDHEPPRSFLRQPGQRGLDGGDVIDPPRAVEADRQGVPGSCRFEQLASHRAESSILSCAAARRARTLSTWRNTRIFPSFHSC